jgi:hypothetical protein
VEKSLAPHVTVALKRPSAWHDATEVTAATAAPDATVERFAAVKGELRVPNTVNYSLFPTLDPFAAVYYQLFYCRGFKRDTCIVSLSSYRNPSHVTAKGTNSINCLNGEG